MIATLPLGATVPVLGLSNKAVFEGSFSYFCQPFMEQYEYRVNKIKASSHRTENLEAMLSHVNSL